VASSLVGYAVETGQLVRLGDIRKAPRYVGADPRVHSALSVPLKYRGRVIGAIDLESWAPNAFSEEDGQLMALIASQLAGLFENARLHAETRRRNQELQKRIEAQQRAESRLIRSARLAAVGEMAAGVAHELNNPLTTIIGFLQLALEELSPQVIKQTDLDLVLSEAQRARGVVRRLLDFSRQSEAVRVSVQVNTLIREVVALIQHQIASSCVELETELAQDLPEVLADPEQLKQVLLNLIQNALQAMPEGGQLTLGSRPQPSPDHPGDPGICLIVSDTGSGIPPESQGRIFEPFYTTRPGGDGTGLGLSVSYGIVTAHHGVIEVRSSAGQGSVFSVWLPVEEKPHGL
jgi:two-component system NtrC family sensor kinase